MADGFELVSRNLERLPAALARQVDVTLRQIVQDGIRHWRAHSPFRTGQLRRAERYRLIPGPHGLIVGATFHVEGPRARVYRILAARRYPHLRRVMNDWVARVGNPRLLAAVRRVSAEHGFDE